MLLLFISCLPHQVGCVVNSCAYWTQTRLGGSVAHDSVFLVFAQVWASAVEPSEGSMTTVFIARGTSVILELVGGVVGSLHRRAWPASA